MRPLEPGSSCRERAQGRGGNGPGAEGEEMGPKMKGGEPGPPRQTGRNQARAKLVVSGGEGGRCSRKTDGRGRVGLCPHWPVNLDGQFASLSYERLGSVYHPMKKKSSSH